VSFWAVEISNGCAVKTLFAVGSKTIVSPTLAYITKGVESALTPSTV
jgi:hypothetical protein